MANDTFVSRYLAAFWDKQQATGLADIAGLDIAVAIPITQPVLDALLEPVTFPEAVRSFRLRFTGNDLIVLEVGLNLFLFKTLLRVEAQVERYVPFPHDPVLTLTLLKRGMVEMGLNVIPLPNWIKAEGQKVRIDLGALLRSHKLDWLITILRDVRFNVHPGVLNIQGRLVVPEPTANELVP